MILHADANSFYASCEQLYRPDLLGKPIIVLSNNDGVIVALNKEAKAYGLKRGDFFYKIEGFCKSNNISVFSSNYTLYADISKRITSIYLDYAPQIEEYSIDESFLFFSKCSKWTLNDFYQAGVEIRQRVKKEVGIPISVGAAPTKTLAKLFNKLAKNFGGVYVYNPENIDSVLASVKAGEIWGIGKSKEETLRRYGILTALQLKHLPLNIAKKMLTIQGFGTVQELNGIQYLSPITKTKNKTITTSRQFSRLVYDIETIECALTKYTQIATERLRAQGDLCGVVQVFLSTCNYAYERDPNKCYSNGISLNLNPPSNYTTEILKNAIHGLKKIFRPGFGYKTVMITLHDLCPNNGQQELWDFDEDNKKKESLMNTVDNLKSLYNKNIITIGREICSYDWETKRSHLSPCWTTQFSDCPRIH